MLSEPSSPLKCSVLLPGPPRGRGSRAPLHAVGVVLQRENELVQRAPQVLPARSYLHTMRGTFYRAHMQYGACFQPVGPTC